MKDNEKRKKQNKSQIVAGFLAIVMVLFILKFYFVLVFFSYRNPIIALLFIVIIALSIVHWKSGRFRNIWLYSIIFFVFFSMIEEQLSSFFNKNNKELRVCKELIKKCEHDPTLGISCLNEKDYCENMIIDHNKLLERLNSDSIIK